MRASTLELRRSDVISLVILTALLLSACSRDQKPIAEAVKPAQETLQAAKGVEQTLQKAQEDREARSSKE